MPTSIVPGSIWVGDERINFGRRNGNTISALTRGAYGTTPQNHKKHNIWLYWAAGMATEPKRAL